MFAKNPNRERLRQYKRIKISGMRFTIRKLNPIIDFPFGKMPQIFTTFISKRKVDPEQQVGEAVLRKSQEDMKLVIQAGLVKPEIPEKVAIEDILADSVLALKLYTEIIIHSLNAFRGLKGVFFSVNLRRLWRTELRKNMDKLLTK